MKTAAGTLLAACVALQSNTAFADLNAEAQTYWTSFFNNNLDAPESNPTSCFAGSNNVNPCSCNFSSRSVTCSVADEIATINLFRNGMTGTFPVDEVNYWLSKGATSISFSNSGSGGNLNEFEYPDGFDCLDISECNTDSFSCSKLDITNVQNAAGTTLEFCTPAPTKAPTTSPTKAPTIEGCSMATLSPTTPKHEINPVNSNARDAFGSAVAIDGDWMVVGAKFDETVSLNHGSAHMYAYNSGTGEWDFHSTIVDDSSSTWALFGAAVDVSGDYVVVGAPRYDPMGINSGAAIVFHLQADAWVQVAVLYPSGGSAYDNSGMDVAIDGDLIVIGSPKDSSCGEDKAGSFTVFENDGGTWTEADTFCDQVAVAKAMCGKAVDISGTKIIVGCNMGNSAFVVDYDASTNAVDYETFPMPGSLEANGWFGMSVAIDGQLAVVGAPFTSGGGYSRAGAAFVYTSDGAGTWTNTKELSDSYPRRNDRYGRDVACSEEYKTILVGAYRDTFYGKTYAGTMFAYYGANSNWSETGKIREDSPKAYDEFARAVAISGNRVAVTTPKGDSNGFNAGGCLTMQLELPDLC